MQERFRTIEQRKLRMQFVKLFARSRLVKIVSLLAHLQRNSQEVGIGNISRERLRYAVVLSKSMRWNLRVNNKGGVSAGSHNCVNSTESNNGDSNTPCFHIRLRRNPYITMVHKT